MSLENLVKRKFRNSLAAIALSSLIAVPLTTIGCHSDNPSREISEELQAEWPIWKNEDLESNKYHGMLVQYDHEINIKPEFYHGKMPLHFVSMQTPGSGMMYGTQKYIQHEFNGFTNCFVYQHFELAGVVAVDDTHHLAAEARIKYVPSEGFPKISMEEFHYSDGFLVYHCVSQVDNATGMKVSESEKSGKKSKDYFFILPIGLGE